MSNHDQKPPSFIKILIGFAIFMAVLLVAIGSGWIGMD